MCRGNGLDHQFGYIQAALHNGMNGALNGFIIGYLNYVAVLFLFLV